MTRAWVVDLVDRKTALQDATRWPEGRYLGEGFVECETLQVDYH